MRNNPSELRLMDLENMLRMIDHLALIRDGIHFKTQQGRRWIKDVFQTRIREMEQELRTTDSLALTSLTGGGRVRGNVPEPLANRLGPLAVENSAIAPVAPNSEEHRWRSDLGGQLIRVRPALRLYRGRVISPPRQLLLLQETIDGRHAGGRN